MRCNGTADGAHMRTARRTLMYNSLEGRILEAWINLSLCVLCLGFIFFFSSVRGGGGGGGLGGSYKNSEK